MSWIQLEIETTLSHYKKIEKTFIRSGMQAISFLDAEDQPIYEPPLKKTVLWKKIRIRGLCDSLGVVKKILKHLQSYWPHLWKLHRVKKIEDKDWSQQWKQNLQPLSFGEKLWIYPSFYTPVDLSKTNLILDPGCSFGTGSHPTTSLCLQWLSHHCLQGKKVIDYGCGSGILGIASFLLGAQHVIGVDIDPQALCSSQKNAKINGIMEKDYQVFLPNSLPPYCCDVILANILTNTLTTLAEDFFHLLNDNGHIILSGILMSQVEQIKKAYENWFIFNSMEYSQEWVMISAIRR